MKDLAHNYKIRNMNCPRCETPLQVSSIKDVNVSIEIDKCPSCGGAWFDKGELAQIENVIEPTFVEIRHIPKKKEQFEPLACPSCNLHQRLQKVVHPRDKKVIIDHCGYCKGVWLDKGELDAIQKENWLISFGKIFKWLAGEEV
ncbi:zf-TFIIB domain-containing protein [Carboxylicivirga sp. M1479]|uniref:TFIIB-type zinc ribbon-containing protein n=1 Tax=Carboxylicivirga sp. M1479 TaxID=2594476 RepID=UPI001178A6EB|nr:zf-TFIIB domain-containing protein [Carboxylicivirga sp. M1479]TRX71117.1 hypothetical protein FNN09_07810 [Carboxylicivirga sp. M1479]